MVILVFGLMVIKEKQCCWKNRGKKMNPPFWIYAQNIENVYSKYNSKYIPIFLSESGLSLGIPFITYNLEQIVEHYKDDEK